MTTRNPIESILRDSLTQYLKQIDAVDNQLPVAPDLEDLWAQVGEAYLPDGMREFNEYPTVSLGWIMYVGMAVAKFWDEDWSKYSAMENLYSYLLSKSDFDNLDDHVKFNILGLNESKASDLEEIVRASAEIVNDNMRHLGIEPGSEQAFRAFVAALHQMYLMGVAMQLKRMGYHMTKM